MPYGLFRYTVRIYSIECRPGKQGDFFTVIDHLSTYATDYAATRQFYEVVLAELGYTVQADYPQYNSCAFGPEGRPVFWVIGVEEVASPRHVAFTAARRDEVDAFYGRGLTSGGSDNGEPGLRSQYHPHYYGAFLLDPDGNNVEAVCHWPVQEGEARDED